MRKKQRKSQAKQEAKTLLQLEQSSKDVQKAELKVAKAQAQLEASRTRLHNLQAKIAEIAPPQDQAHQAPQSDQTPQSLAMQGKGPLLPQYGLYAYGMVSRSPEHLDILGIDKKNKVYPIAGRDICVMVSEIDIDQFQKQVKILSAELTKNAETLQSGVTEILQAHENVIDILMQDTTIVPLKFGTLLKDEKAASKMLQDHEEEFKGLLAKFCGKVECGLKVYADKQVVMRHIMQVNPKFASLREKREKLSRGAIYLLERKREEELKDHLAAQLAQVTEVIFQELGKNAFEAKQNNTLSQKITGKKKEMILNAVFLVKREEVAHFCEQGKRFVEQYEFMELDSEFSGPWPPYNFT